MCSNTMCFNCRRDYFIGFVSLCQYVVSRWIGQCWSIFCNYPTLYCCVMFELLKPGTPLNIINSCIERNQNTTGVCEWALLIIAQLYDHFIQRWGFVSIIIIINQIPRLLILLLKWQVFHVSTKPWVDVIRSFEKCWRHQSRRVSLGLIVHNFQF